MTTMTGGDRQTRLRTAYRGCLLGGAVGDALGAPVEFMKLGEIRRRFGPAGVTGLEESIGRRGTITDDTQMTLFTAEGLIRWENQGEKREVPVSQAVHRAYLRWLGTQGELVDVPGRPGWLVGVRGLHARRAPGETCLSALRSGQAGARGSPLNDSKGCGAVMRVAPVGLACLEDPFAVGCELAALTHGHPTGQLAAGAMAQLVAELVEGAGLHDAVQRVLARLAVEPEHEETSRTLGMAVDLARHGRPSASAVSSLGRGWVAEEALAIGVFCALAATSFEEGVLLAVNHDGDSDSTGSIAGNLLGLAFGEESIPPRFLEELELLETVTAVAKDLWAHFGAAAPSPRRDLDRYPSG